MKLYRMNDYDWWAGPTLEATVSAYASEVYLTKDEIMEDEPREVTEEEMDRLRFYEDHPSREGESRSFREEFSNRIAELPEHRPPDPFLFASTEW